MISKRVLAAVATGATLVTWVWAFVWAAQSDVSDDSLASVRFTALGAATALLALIAAIAAALFTYPAFAAWRTERTARAALSIAFQVSWWNYRPPRDVVAGQTIDVPEITQLIVVIRNTAKISARDAVLNIMVNYWVDVAPIDPEPPDLRVRSTVASVPNLTGAEGIEVATVAKARERAIHPDVIYLYTVRLKATARRPYVVRVQASGLRTDSSSAWVRLNPVLPPPELEPEHPGTTATELEAGAD